jgi:hypothetical protein
MPNVDHFLVAPDPVIATRDERELELSRLRRRIDELERQLGERVRPALSHADGYTLFFLGRDGYEVVDGDGVAPAVGTSVVIRGEPFTVEAVRRSPFPSDRRPCLVASPPRSPQTSDRTTDAG